MLNQMDFPYGTCTTAAATADKVVTITHGHFVLKEGCTVFVKFTIANTAAVGSLTLNVNNTGAKNIKYANQGNLPDKGIIRANQTCMFTYDGTYWIFMNVYYNTNNYKSVVAANNTSDVDYRVVLNHSAVDTAENNVALNKSNELLFNPSKADLTVGNSSQYVKVFGEDGSMILHGAKSGDEENNVLKLNISSSDGIYEVIDYRSASNDRIWSINNNGTTLGLLISSSQISDTIGLDKGGTGKSVSSDANLLKALKAIGYTAGNLTATTAYTNTQNGNVSAYVKLRINDGTNNIDLFIMYGVTTTSSANTQTINFPTSFSYYPTVTISLLGDDNRPLEGAWQLLNIRAVTKSGFTVSSAGHSDTKSGVTVNEKWLRVHWIAIGR